MLSPQEQRHRPSKLQRKSSSLKQRSLKRYTTDLPEVQLVLRPTTGNGDNVLRSEAPGYNIASLRQALEYRCFGLSLAG